MSNIVFRLAIPAMALVGSLSLAAPADAGLTLTISDSLGTTAVTVVGTQPGGPGTDLVASYSGNFGGLSLIVSVGDSNSPSLTDPARVDTTVVVSGGTPTAADVLTITVTDNGVTFPVGSSATLISSAAANAAGNATMTFQGTAAGTSTPLQTIAAGSTTGSVVSSSIGSGLTAPYTMTGTTTLAFAAGVRAFASIDNALAVSAPEPSPMIVWSLVACTVAIPSLRRRWRAA